MLTVSLTSWSDPLLLLVSALRAGAILVLSPLQQWEVCDWTTIATQLSCAALSMAWRQSGTEKLQG